MSDIDTALCLIRRFVVKVRSCHTMFPPSMTISWGLSVSGDAIVLLIESVYSE